ncbi:MAG TPA: protease modulator HflC [Verrucomicrobiae bacterium]|nr:protease modulator HflC [Verrucomicrobiae bacterium]
MKRNSLIVVVGVLLVVIFAFWLCAFQVRTTEVAVVTTFGKATRPLSAPGLYFKWPPPVQRVYKFDQRVQSSDFENKFREDLTADNNPLLTSVYIGWRITAPDVFLQKFPSGIPAVEQQLANLLSTAKSAVVGKHPLSDFVSANNGGSKFAAIEDEILESVREQLKQNNYGIEIEFLGFKKIGLPEDTTQKVFDRMTSERQVLISRAQNEGEAQARIIRSDADLRASKILTAAQGEALRIQGQGEAEASKYLAAFQQNPQLASFLFRLDALQDSLKEKSTLIFDQQTEPFTLFKGAVTNLPSK